MIDAKVGAWGALALTLVACGLGGCKNPCEKALDHVMSCMADFCHAHADSSTCRQLAARQAHAPECDDREKQQAEVMLGQSCDVLGQAFRQYVNAAQTVEGASNIRRITLGAQSYYDNEHASPSGDLLPYQFPASVARTPAQVPCGERVAPNAADWEQPTWQALEFSVEEPHYFSYQFDAAGSGASATFTASAFGDLDCDGVLSTFERTGHVSNGEVVIDELRSFDEEE